MVDYLPVGKTRCGQLAKAIFDEEEAAIFYNNLRNILGKENNDIVEEIMLDEADHKQKFKKIYKSLCISEHDEIESAITVGKIPVKEAW